MPWRGPVSDSAAEDLHHIVEVAKTWSGGGTDWSPAIQAGLHRMTGEDKAWQRADLVLITDGIADDLTPAVREALDAAPKAKVCG